VGAIGPYSHLLLILSIRMGVPLQNSIVVGDEDILAVVELLFVEISLVELLDVVLECVLLGNSQKQQAANQEMSEHLLLL
jgi:hypothetical protein